MNRMTSGSNDRGFTLLELIISMVVVSIALGGVLMVINTAILHSADPMLEHQAVAIAESYLEEVLLQAYSDPDGTTGETLRGLYDDVDDYNGLSDAGARDQAGNAITGLESYTVGVAVAGTTLNGVNSKRVMVTVTHPSGINWSISGYRTNY